MENPFAHVAENRPIRDIAYEQLKHAIITGQIPAGSRIVETAYADRLHISRTPLREALQKLERDGLVEYVLHRGVMVRAFTISDVEEIFAIRNAMMMLLLPSVVENAKEKDIDKLYHIVEEIDQALEAGNMERTAELNRAFHKGLEQLSDKRRIMRVIESQEEYIMKFSAVSISSIERRQVVNQEHYQMVEMLRNKDLDGLLQLHRHHLEESKTACLNAIKGRGF